VLNISVKNINHNMTCDTFQLSCQLFC